MLAKLQVMSVSSTVVDAVCDALVNRPFERLLHMLRDITIKQFQDKLRRI